MTLPRVALGFVAGFIATLVFHQGGLAILHAIGLTDRAPYALAATKPFGVPAVVSLACWGGVWGIDGLWGIGTALLLRLFTR